MFAKVGDTIIWEEHIANILGILIVSDLSCNDQVKMICKNVSQNLSAISRMTDIISVERRNTLLNAFLDASSAKCSSI